jgi:hypothetical protein
LDAARDRLASLKAAKDRAIALAELREQAEERKDLAQQLVEIAAELDQLGAQFVHRAKALALGCQELRECGGGPSDAQVVMLWRTVSSIVMDTPWHRAIERVAPNERKSFSYFIGQWTGTIVREADAVLGDGEQTNSEAA